MAATVGQDRPLVVPDGTKHELTRTQLADYLAGYAEAGLADLMRVIACGSGILDEAGPAGNPLRLQAGTAVDTFRVRAGVGFLLRAVGDCEALDLVDWTDAGNVECANALGVLYNVGVRLARVPLPSADGLTVNRRTGVPEYVVRRLEAGEYGQPDTYSYNAVTDQITMTVGTVVGGGSEDHGSRDVRAWLVAPATGAAAQAFAGTVAGFAGGTYVAAFPGGVRFGMTAAQAAAAVAADFRVIMPGVRVVRVATKDLAADANYLYLGDFTGGGPGNPIGAVDVSLVPHLRSLAALADHMSGTGLNHQALEISDGTGGGYHGATVQLTLDALNTALVAHLNGGASKHDASEIDDETVGGHHGATVQATLDTLNTHLTDAEARPGAYAWGEVAAAGGWAVDGATPIRSGGWHPTWTPAALGAGRYRLWLQTGTANIQRITVLVTPTTAGKIASEERASRNALGQLDFVVAFHEPVAHGGGAADGGATASGAVGFHVAVFLYL